MVVGVLLLFSSLLESICGTPSFWRSRLLQGLVEFVRGFSILATLEYAGPLLACPALVFSLRTNGNAKGHSDIDGLSSICHHARSID
jgi:hypothetical protein